MLKDDRPASRAFRNATKVEWTLRAAGTSLSLAKGAFWTHRHHDRWALGGGGRKRKWRRPYRRHENTTPEQSGRQFFRPRTHRERRQRGGRRISLVAISERNGFPNRMRRFLQGRSRARQPGPFSRQRCTFSSLPNRPLSPVIPQPQNTPIPFFGIDIR